MKKKTPSQTDLVLQYIKEYGSITQAEAITLGCYRLAARIADLRKLGHPVTVSYLKVKKANGKTTTVAQYGLREGE